MQDTYWKRFMTSGKIDDYLNYKNSGTDSAEEEPHYDRGMKNTAEIQPCGSDPGLRTVGRILEEDERGGKE